MLSPIDYLGHVRDLNLKSSAVNMDWIWQDDRRAREFVEEYVGGTEFEYQSPLDCALARSFDDDDDDDERYLRQGHHALIYREAVWCLSNPILEQLQSLTIPVSEIGRYRPVVGRLRSLKNFSGDDDGVGVVHEIRIRKEAALRATVEFVKDHGRLFSGRLKKANFSSFWGYGYESWPHDVEFELFEVLPPLAGIATLHAFNLAQCMAHPLATDISQVEAVTLTRHPDS
ncbi:hypothetical protein BGX23_011764 [Mortierella sp. AD031]|nr:hypothetical protein BGX23_011764 [Mortierella sp. AD031]